jgi:hypothetical protein
LVLAPALQSPEDSEIKGGLPVRHIVPRLWQTPWISRKKTYGSRPAYAFLTGFVCAENDRETPLPCD